MRALALTLFVLVAAAGVLAQEPITKFGSFAGRGFDIVNERVKPRLITHTYGGGYTMFWKGTEYAIPDELYDTPTPRTVFDSKIRLFQRTQDHFESVVKSTTISAGLTVSGVTLQGAFSKTKGDVDTLLKNGTRAFSMATNLVEFFQLGVYPGSSLDPRFASAVRLLPATYDASAYGRFIHGWGTHYINNAQLGGSVNFTTDFDQQLIQSNSISWVERQVGFSIGYAMFNLNFNSSLAKNTTDFDRQFSESANSTKEIVGGRGDILESEGFSAWARSLEETPAMLLTRSEVYPVSELIENSNIRRNVERAIIDFCNNAGFRIQIENMMRHDKFNRIPLYDDEQPGLSL